MKAIITLLLAIMVPCAAMAATTPALTPFTATYQVLRKGSPLGESTLKLVRNGDATWTFTSSLKATSGLAAVLGGSISEKSHFMLHDGRMMPLTYDFSMHTAIKSRTRHLTVDWGKHAVTATEDDKTKHYATVPGMVDHQLMILALAQAVRAGKTSIALQVADEDDVDKQTYAMDKPAALTVPAGKIKAVRVNRTHDDKGFSVWFAPSKTGLAPVKLAQKEDGDITMLLKSYKAQ